MKKIIKVDVMDYYNPVKFKNYKVVPEELAPLFGKYKNEMCDIATVSYTHLAMLDLGKGSGPMNHAFAIKCD